ncbi:MAG: DUF2177 family protein [Burkholderiaceae bacterium]|jgi:uncharacterized membrane protein
MKVWVLAYVTTLVVYLALDATWLGLVAKQFYQSEIGNLMAAEPNLVAAAAFYLSYVVGVVVFVVRPALTRRSATRAILAGALFGLLAYGTYDLTNLATLKGWTVTMTVVDMSWGLFATAFSAGVAYAVARRLAARDDLWF